MLSFIEHPPRFFRKFFPYGFWYCPQSKKTVYLTFDDGPIPEVTPWVLDVLKQYGIKATFFMVGDNVRKHPDVYQMVKDAGHSIGNHTFNHVQGFKMKTADYVANVELADSYIHSHLFRPPHGQFFKRLWTAISPKYKVVFWDVVTRDYNKSLSGEYVLNVVKRFTRNGSVIVFHDSLKSEERLRYALPKAIEWLLEQGYRFDVVD
ncbi:MAG: polysaccharide deacetylase family protein [Paludibacteraceae bacterium]|nr:polysaccharide deacetylase family protein [Paludibacteraceae bacterium]